MPRPTTGKRREARGLIKVVVDVETRTCEHNSPSAHHWATAASVVGEVLPVLMRHPQGTVFNVNVPNVDPATPVEVREATLAPFGIVQTTMTEPVEGDVRLTVRELPDRPIEGSDAALLAAGFATVTNVVAVQQAPGSVFAR